MSEGIPYCYIWNRSGSYQPDEATLTYNRFNYFINGPATMTLVLLGVICNAVSIAVFLQPQRLLCIYYYLITLAIWDIALLLMASLLYSFPTLYYGYLSDKGTYVYTYRFWYTGSNICLIGSVWVVLILTIDRYTALCHPLKHQTVVSRDGVKKLLIFVSFLAIIYGIPRYFELTYEFCYHSVWDKVVPQIMPTSLRSHLVYDIVYKIVGSLIFYSALPFVLLLVLTVRISLAIRNSKRMHMIMTRANTRSLSPHRKESSLMNVDRSSNVLLLAVASKFLVSRLIPTALDVAETILGQELFTRELIANYAVDISNLVVVLNSLTNSWTYFAFGQSFRREFFKLFHHGGHKDSCKLTRKYSPKISNTLVVSGSGAESPLLGSRVVSSCNIDYKSFNGTLKAKGATPCTDVDFRSSKFIRIRSNDTWSGNLEIDSMEIMV